MITKVLSIATTAITSSVTSTFTLTSNFRPCWTSLSEAKGYFLLWRALPTDGNKKKKTLEYLSDNGRANKSTTSANGKTIYCKWTPGYRETTRRSRKTLLPAEYASFQESVLREAGEPAFAVRNWSRTINGDKKAIGEWRSVLLVKLHWYHGRCRALCSGVNKRTAEGNVQET